MVDMSVTGVIVLAHGSRGERGKPEVEASLARITAGLKPLLARNVEIVGATLQFNKPSLEEAVASLSAKGISHIVIAPYFLFPGRHITEHIPQIIKDLQLTYPRTRFILADNLGLDGYFILLMAKRIVHSSPELSPYPPGNLANAIEQESMRIIGSLVSSLQTMSDEEAVVARRIVHACGDAEVARLISFSRTAVSCGVAAIVGGSPIFTDVRMVMAGIDSRLSEAFGCSVSCALDEADAPEPDMEGGTRTARAMNSLGARLNGAIVAIGNAPTALLALLDMIDKNQIRPALVVGMPVGFVKAEESKQELMQRDIPYITVTGTRGGSAMAAATVNSLLRIAAGKKAGAMRKEVRSD